MQNGDRNTQMQLRNLTAIAPTVHHRFDKESVHLRSMYRQLHPPTSETSSNSPHRNTKRYPGGQSLDNVVAKAS